MHIVSTSVFKRLGRQSVREYVLFLKLILVSYLFFRQVKFENDNLNFYFMKTANIPLYGNIAVYIKYYAVCLKIDYTLRCFEYICSVYSLL